MAKREREASKRPFLVLWIEDNLEREMDGYLEYLEELGKYDFLVAQNVREAEEMLAQYRDSLDAVILDIILPIGVDVIDSTEEMMRAGIMFYQKHLKHRGLPVVVVSCLPKGELADELLADKNVVGLFKPFFPKSLENALGKVLRRKR